MPLSDGFTFCAILAKQPNVFGVLQLIAAIAGDNEGPFGAYQLSSSVMVSVFIKKFQF